MVFIMEVMLEYHILLILKPYSHFRYNFMILKQNVSQILLYSFKVSALNYFYGDTETEMKHKLLTCQHVC